MLINISNLNKSYINKNYSLNVLKKIDLTVSEGEFISIMGKSGCGKSTLLNIIGLIDRYDSGEYFLGEMCIKELKNSQLAKLRLAKFGYIYQSYNLISSLNCLDNVELTQGYAGITKKNRKERAEQLMELVGLKDKIKVYPAQLSGGEQQRLSIARALSNNPQIILADEPTGSLDYKTGTEIMSILKELNNKGTAIIVVTHDMEIANYATKNLNLVDGVLQ